MQKPFAGARGSAAVEFIVMAPLILILLGAVWDLREFIAYRTDLARTAYVVAEAIANELDDESPIDDALGALQEQLEATTESGFLSAAVVVRGTEAPPGGSCPQTCRPMVRRVADQAVRWGATDAQCADAATGLPAVGGHLAAAARLLPNEGAPDVDGAPVAEKDWVSRSLGADEWWVVVDLCVDPVPGRFIGRLTNWAGRMLDTSAFTWRRRVAWGSIHDLADCAWCAPGGGT